MNLLLWSGDGDCRNAYITMDWAPCLVHAMEVWIHSKRPRGPPFDLRDTWPPIVVVNDRSERMDIRRWPWFPAWYDNFLPVGRAHRRQWIRTWTRFRWRHHRSHIRYRIVSGRLARMDGVVRDDAVPHRACDSRNTSDFPERRDNTVDGEAGIWRRPWDGGVGH